jgi:hypothetical protein
MLIEILYWSYHVEEELVGWAAWATGVKRNRNNGIEKICNQHHDSRKLIETSSKLSNKNIFDDENFPLIL